MNERIEVRIGVNTYVLEVSQTETTTGETAWTWLMTKPIRALRHYETREDALYNGLRALVSVAECEEA